MKKAVIAAAATLVIGILLGYVLFGTKKQTEYKRDTGSSSLVTEKEEQLDANSVNSETNKETATRGSSLTKKPEITVRSQKDIEEEKKRREEFLASKLPQDISHIKKLASKKDQDSIGKTIGIYREGGMSKQVAIELEACQNPKLKEELWQDIYNNLSSDDESTRASAIKSAVRIKAFDKPQRSEIRSLLNDSSPRVKKEAISYAGRSRDKDAFNDVLRILDSTEDERTTISALSCMSVIGKDRSDDLIFILLAKLNDKSPHIRQTALSCIIHLRKPMNNSEIKDILQTLSETDNYRIARNDKEQYPIREQAKRALRLSRDIK